MYYICEIIENFNYRNKKINEISKSFQQCGLNYLCENIDVFI